MKFKNLVVAFSALLASGMNLNSNRAVQAEEAIIGAWNIEWLGFPDMRGRPGKDLPQKPSDLAERIHQSKVDILALEEIGVDSTESLRSKELDKVFELLKKDHKQEWEYILFSKTAYPEDAEEFQIRGQHIGVAWNKAKASKVGEPYSIDVGANETYGLKFWERRANAVKFSFGENKTDVVVVPAHLKSNRNDEHPEDKDWTRKHRAAEAESLVAQLAALKSHFSDEDIVLLGDFNFLKDDDEGPQAIIKAGFNDLNDADEGTTTAWGEGYSSAPFDRIFVPASQGEFKKSELKVFRSESDDDSIREHRKRYSDHYIVTCEIEIGEDDD